MDGLAWVVAIMMAAGIHVARAKCERKRREGLVLRGLAARRWKIRKQMEVGPKGYMRMKLLSTLFVR